MPEFVTENALQREKFVRDARIHGHWNIHQLEGDSFKVTLKRHQAIVFLNDRWISSFWSPYNTENTWVNNRSAGDFVVVDTEERKTTLYMWKETE